ncbi:MAG: type IV pilus twitching motility protein PilT [Chloroherpetonaceae bacterium]|nr:type IV pilus twitching motility protein PilT [Chthonomonadaceae bacterium]MDW8208757.1 type IV pilus twitching motility protein PilT [Chloroherpetonaceae bacterium]
MALVLLDQLLQACVYNEGSDLHIKADSPPLVRIHGDLLPLDIDPSAPEPVALSAEEAKWLCYSVLSDVQKARFEEELELDFAYEIKGVARFRANLFVQRGNVGGVFRVIPYEIKTMEDLNLPTVCRQFCERPRGLVLVTGPAGSGKSTTQAAMIDYINRNFAVHVITVEDPVEFVHQDYKALINQRELDTDTLAFPAALRSALREDPDVILIGEMRDLETIQLAITAAETGHLVFGTLHTTDAVQTVDRVIDVFPTHQQQQVRMQMSVNLLGVISQTLVKRKDGKGRVAAFETLVAIPAVRNLIREAKTHQIGSIIQTGQRHGMQTLDQSLAKLVRDGLVSYEDALAKASNPIEFRALVKDEDMRLGRNGLL